MRAAARWFWRYRITFLAFAVVVALCGSVVLAAAREHDRSVQDRINHQLAQQACASALRVRDAFIDVLIDAQRRTLNSPTATAAQKREAVDFYVESVSKLKAAVCVR